MPDLHTSYSTTDATSEAAPPQNDMKRTLASSSSCTSLEDDGDGGESERDRLVDHGYMSDTEYVLEDTQSSSTDSEPRSDEEERQDHHHHTGKHVYTSACARLGIVPASLVLSRLSSDRLSLRHALLNPASAAALSAGLAFNRTIRSLNLGSNLLGDDSARILLEAMSDNPSLTKLDLSRNLLSDRLGELLAQSVSSPLCALRDLVLADNLLSDRFTDALSTGLRNLGKLSLSPLRNLDVSNNKICDRNGETLASILCSCSLCSLNLSWNDLNNYGRNDLRESETSKKGRAADPSVSSPLASAALVHPGRLVSLELSFNGLSDAVGVIFGGMLAGNTSLSVLDLSRNHLDKLAAFSIADGLKTNRGLRTLKLGWNSLGREGTLGIIRAIGDNRGPLQVVRLENTTDAGLEFEAAHQAELAVANRAQWVEGLEWGSLTYHSVGCPLAAEGIKAFADLLAVVCEYPDRARTKGNSHSGAVSWMTEFAPDVEHNTTYKTRQEQEYDERSHSTAAPAGSATPGGIPNTTLTTTRMTTVGVAVGARRPSSARIGVPLPAAPAPSSRSPRTGHLGKSPGGATAAVVFEEEEEEEEKEKEEEEEEKQPPRRSFFGPAKEAVAIPVLSVRLKLRAQQEARLEAERLAALEAAAAEEKEEKEKKAAAALSYLKPLNKSVRQKTLTEPPPRLLLLRKAKVRAGTYSAMRRSRDDDDSADAGGGRSSETTKSRGRTSTPRGLYSSTIKKRTARGRHSKSSQSIPAYVGTISQRVARGAPQSALGRFKTSGNVPRGPRNSTDRRLEADSRSGQRRTSTGRGRSGLASRSRTGSVAATRSWRGGDHAAKSRSSSRVSIKSSRDRRGRSKSATSRRTTTRSRSSAVGSRSSTWHRLAMSSIVQAVAPPSRLKLRVGGGQEQGSIDY